MSVLENIIIQHKKKQSLKNVKVVRKVSNIERVNDLDNNLNIKKVKVSEEFEYEKTEDSINEKRPLNF